ncbi:MAG: rRNA maturation RNase YbeY [Actinobacteria bacterium]|nr:rRNA maturation RNase YbeY [Actinomycetota bacterium]
MSVFLANEQSVEVDVAELRGLAELVLSEEGYPPITEVTILLVADDEMSGYNQRFLDREGPTDVLAFPVEQLIPGLVPDLDPKGPPLMAGDVVVAPEYVARQAERLDVPFEDEMALMVAHGVLHLLGYDHETEEQSELMERRERDLLGRMGRARR